MNFEVPTNLAFEQDGISFIGKRDIYRLTAFPYDDTITLNWKSDGTTEKTTIFMSLLDNYQLFYHREGSAFFYHKDIIDKHNFVDHHNLDILDL